MKVLAPLRDLLVRVGSLAALAAVLAGCTLFDKPIQPPKGKTAEELYDEGSSKLGQQKYREALEAFYKLKYDYPAETASQLASLKIADAHYANKEYAEAIENYEEFRKLHPASQYVPYVIYMLGLSHFQRTLSVDRDQTNTQKALNEFQYLLTHFSNTPYAYDASERAKECMKRLSDHEVYVGDFYYRMRKWPAAIQRYEAAISKYPGIPLEDETLFQLAEAYRQNQQQENAQKTLAAIVQQYPKSKYADRAQRLAKEPLPPPQPAPSKDTASEAHAHKKAVEVAAPPPESSKVKKEEPTKAAPPEKPPEPRSDERAAASQPPPPPPSTTEPPPEMPVPAAPASRLPEPSRIQQAEPPPRNQALEEKPRPPSVEETAVSAPTPVIARASESPPAQPSVSAKALEAPTSLPPTASRAAEPPAPPVSQRNLGPEEAAAPTESMVASGPSVSRKSKTSESKGQDEPLGFGELRGDRPINITADRMDAFQRENRVVFEGNVVVRQDDTFIYARRITADTAPQEAGGGIRKVVALRDVRITQNDRVATCDKAEFDHISRTIELSGKPKIWQGKDWIDGEKVLVQLDQEKVTVVGSQDKRVSAVLHPKGSKEETPGAAEAPKGKRPSLTAPFAPPTRPAPPPEPQTAARATAPPSAPSEPPEMARAASSPPPPVQPPPVQEKSLPHAPERATSPPANIAEGSSPVEPTPFAETTASTSSSSHVEDEAARIASAALTRKESKRTATPAETPRSNSERIAPPSSPASPPSPVSPADSPEGFLERWRKAWESKDLEGYMSYYSSRFHSGKHDWNGWREYKADLNRKYRNIRVQVEDVKVTPSPEGVTVSFLQRYRADAYADEGRKTLELVKEDGGWKILKEGFGKAASEAVPAGPQTKDEPRPRGEGEEPSAGRDAVMALLSEWQRCWEKRDFQGYFALYSDDFRGDGLDLKGLRGKRAQQMALAQSIRVTLSEIQVSVRGDMAQARFTQEFRSDAHQDRGSKLLRLRREGGVWRIVEERWQAL